MKDIKRTLMETLHEAAKQTRAARLQEDIASRLETLATNVNQPCVVAIVGKMKAGKSTFINAFLGKDLAKVGVTETTATINYFRYGNPPDDTFPVMCHWENGRVENVSREFLDNLQGNDEKTLERSAQIKYLEYLLPEPVLQQVTLVDTPGTTAAVDKHQNVTATFLGLQKQLRDRHNEATEQIGSEADAVIYVMDAVGRRNDQEFLDEFQQVTQGRAKALNAIGVMAKIDLQPEIMSRRHSLAGKISEQLKDSLNTVIPLSAGIRRILDQLLENECAGLISLIESLRLVNDASPETQRKLFASDMFWKQKEFNDCAFSAAQRRELLGTMNWGVFTTVSRTLIEAGLDLEAGLTQLNDLCGFGPLKKVLEQHFFQRSHLLRCFKIVNDARKLVSSIRYKHLFEFRKKDRKETARLERFLTFVKTASGDPEIAREIEQYFSIQAKVAGQRAQRLEAIVEDLDRKLSAIFHLLDEENADFEALNKLENYSNLFSEGELSELKNLFGLYGRDITNRLPDGSDANHVEIRQGEWNDISLNSRNPIRCEIAERAAERYGLIIDEMEKSS